MSRDPHLASRIDVLTEVADEVVGMWNAAAAGNKIFDAGQRRMASRIFNLISRKIVDNGGDPITMEDL